MRLPTCHVRAVPQLVQRRQGWVQRVPPHLWQHAGGQLRVLEVDACWVGRQAAGPRTEAQPVHAEHTRCATACMGQAASSAAAPTRVHNAHDDVGAVSCVAAGWGHRWRRPPRRRLGCPHRAAHRQVPCSFGPHPLHRPLLAAPQPGGGRDRLSHCMGQPRPIPPGHGSVTLPPTAAARCSLVERVVGGACRKDDVILHSPLHICRQHGCPSMSGCVCPAQGDLGGLEQAMWSGPSQPHSPAPSLALSSCRA